MGSTKGNGGDMPGVPLMPMLPVDVNVVTPPAATTWPTSSSMNLVLKLDGTIEVLFCCCAWEATIAKNKKIQLKINKS